MLRKSTTSVAVSGLTALALVSGATGAFASPAPSPSPEDSGKLTIVASTNLYGDVARQVAGAGAEVKTILSSSDTAPWKYSASAEDKKLIGSADVVVKNGGDYDTFMNVRSNSDKSRTSSPTGSPVVLEALDYVSADDLAPSTTPSPSPSSAAPTTTASPTATGSASASPSGTASSTGTPAATPSESASKSSAGQNQGEEKGFFSLFLENMFGGGSAAVPSVSTEQAAQTASLPASPGASATPTPSSSASSTSSSTPKPTSSSTPSSTSSKTPTSSTAASADAAEEADLSLFAAYDVKAIGALADDMAAKLGKIDEKNATTYTDNAKKFNEALTPAVQKMDAMKSQGPGKDALSTPNGPNDLMASVGLTVKTLEAGDEPAASASPEPASSDSASPAASPAPSPSSTSSSSATPSSTRTGGSSVKSSGASEPTKSASGTSTPSALKKEKGSGLTPEEAEKMLRDGQVALVGTNPFDADANSEKVKQVAAEAGVPVVAFDEQATPDTTYAAWIEKTLTDLEATLQQ